MTRTKAPKGSPGHSAGRGIVLDVTPEIITNAVQRDSSHCVIADALKAAVPAARAITVDLQTIRFTDPASERRYVYFTPQGAQVVLVKFDQGIKPEPFLLKLGRPCQIARAGTGHPGRRKGSSSTTVKKAAGGQPKPLPEGDAKKVTNVRRDGTPVVLGGKLPPTAALSSTRGRRRTFGLKSLRP